MTFVKPTYNRSALHIVRGCLLLMMALAVSCVEEEKHNPVRVVKRDLLKENGMRPSQPVIVEAPNQKSDVPLSDTLFIISIRDDEYITTFRSDTTTLHSISGLKAILKENKTAISKTQLVLDNRSLIHERLDSVGSLLKDLDLLRFNWIRDVD